MLMGELDRADNKPPRLSLEIARSEKAVREAQVLRYRIFADELGAHIASKLEGIDRDVFDPHCEHLLVRDNLSGEVVGTYRMLPPYRASRIGGFYADEEFDLRRLNNLRDHIVELGRSCVHPEYRNGSTIALLWSGIAQYLRQHGYRYLMGCASVSLLDGGFTAAQVFNLVKEKHYSSVEQRVFPINPLPKEVLATSPAITMIGRHVPPLIKGYLRAGAQVCGEPAWDARFNTADLLMLLCVDDLTERHSARFMNARSV